MGIRGCGPLLGYIGFGSVRVKRSSSISTCGFVDKFPHVAGQFGAEFHRFAGRRMDKAQLRRVKRLTPESEAFEKAAKRFRRASIDWVSQ